MQLELHFVKPLGAGGRSMCSGRERTGENASRESREESWQGSEQLGDAFKVIDSRKRLRCAGCRGYGPANLHDSSR